MNLLEKTCSEIYPQDSEYRERARARLDQLTMPHWALGDLMDLGIDLAGITRSMNPPVARKAIVTMAGDHGVVAEGVSKFPSEVTPQMVHNILAGGAGINALASQAGADVYVADLGVNFDFTDIGDTRFFINRKIAYGTNNIAVGPAMSTCRSEWESRRPFVPASPTNAEYRCASRRIRPAPQTSDNAIAGSSTCWRSATSAEVTMMSP